MSKQPGYHSDSETLGGMPVFMGTRVPVQSLFAHLEAGDSIDDFLEGFPSVKREQVIALLEESKHKLLPVFVVRHATPRSCYVADYFAE